MTDVRQRFELDGSLPMRVVVHDTTPPDHATRLFSVVLIYGWAQRISAAGCYLHDANDIALSIGDHLRIPVSIHADERAGESR